MQQLECKQELIVEDKKKLRELLTATQIAEFETGKLVATNVLGTKLRLDDEVKGIITVLTPLQGG